MTEVQEPEAKWKSGKVEWEVEALLILEIHNLVPFMLSLHPPALSPPETSVQVVLQPHMFFFSHVLPPLARFIPRQFTFSSLTLSRPPELEHQSRNRNYAKPRHQPHSGVGEATTPIQDTSQTVATEHNPITPCFPTIHRSAVEY